MAENIRKTEPAQILVVEDDTEIRELISLLLLRQGHRVQQSSSVLEALELLSSYKFNLIVLDWMLPNMSGVDLLKNLNEFPSVKPSVLMVTAKSEPADIVLGLEAGADDYLPKPFEPAVLIARVKALLRRAQKEQIKADVEKIVMGPIHINLRSHEVKMDQQTMHLTPSEYKILVEMGQNQGKVLTREHFILIVQGEGVSVTDRTIDTHVFGLRKKMGVHSELIETIRGVGYRVRVAE